MTASQDSILPLISIVICTYHRPDLLSAALQSLVDQSLSADQFEIIIIDNGPSTSTAKVVSEFQTKHPNHSILYQEEPRSGSGQARHTGFTISRSPWIGFMDDDARARSDWLETACEIIQNQERLDGFGGRIFPFYVGEKPTWFKDEYEIRNWGDSARWLRTNEAFSGSNMFFHRNSLCLVIDTSRAGGMTGESAGFGEDNILFEKLWAIKHGEGARFYYEPELAVFHAVLPYKYSVRYLLGRQFQIGRANYTRNVSNQRILKLKIGLTALVLVFFYGLQGLLKFRFNKQWQNWVYEEFGPMVKKLGVVCGLLGIDFVLNRK